MFNHRLTFAWSNAGGTTLSKTVTVTAGAEHNIDESIPATTADKLVACTLDVSQCKGFYLVADKDVIVETNAADHSGGNIFTLAAGKPFVWVDGNPAMRDTAGNLVVDITSLHVTNAGDAAALLSVRCLVDPTV